MNSKKFRKKLFEILNKKKVYSRYSNELVDFVDSISVDDAISAHKNGKVICDLIFLIDGVANVESDIKKMYFEMESPCECKGNYYNFYDFFNENGIFNKDFKPKKFLENINTYVENRKDEYYE